jgi:hypothetical protein
MGKVPNDSATAEVELQHLGTSESLMRPRKEDRTRNCRLDTLLIITSKLLSYFRNVPWL